jgi:FAD/FMN-containing dehydrogenase
MPLSAQQLIDQFGARAVITGAPIPKAVLRPRSTEEASRMMALCHAARQTVVPWGGLTGLVGGTECQADDVALSLQLMSGIEEVDAVALTMTVKAGTPLASVQQAADAQDLFFPLDLGARGSATIGGNIATNAGGNRVLRYGMMRDLVLGVEAVLADGRIVSSMAALLKNNTGLDLKQLFIGTEGTLGIVTRAVLRLWPKAERTEAAFIACASVDAMVKTMRRLNRALSGRLTSFEAMWPAFYQQVTLPGRAVAPLPYGHACYALVEAGLGQSDPPLLEELLGSALADGLVEDAVIAQSEAQRAAFWEARDGVHYLYKDGIDHHNDVSVQISSIDAYVAEVHALLAARVPACRHFTFGHIGDGNIHFSIGYVTDAETLKRVDSCIYGPLPHYRGSVSAEHGIGILKREKLYLSRSPDELAVMTAVKRALDPENILNPGKIL